MAYHLYNDPSDVLHPNLFKQAGNVEDVGFPFEFTPFFRACQFRIFLTESSLIYLFIYLFINHK
jgi:hypothetical protein